MGVLECVSVGGVGEEEEGRRRVYGESDEAELQGSVLAEHLARFWDEA